MNVKQISIFIENRPGSLYEVVETLAENDIHIRAFTVMESGNITTLRLIIDNVLWASSILKNSGYNAAFSEVLVINIANVAGGLSRVLEAMNDAGINIEHIYSMTDKNISGVLVFEVDDVKKASGVLKDNGIKVITQEELYVL